MFKQYPFPLGDVSIMDGIDEGWFLVLQFLKNNFILQLTCTLLRDFHDIVISDLSARHEFCDCSII